MDKEGLELDGMLHLVAEVIGGQRPLWEFFPEVSHEIPVSRKLAVGREITLLGQGVEAILRVVVYTQDNDEFLRLSPERPVGIDVGPLGHLDIDVRGEDPVDLFEALSIFRRKGALDLLDEP